MAAKAVGVGIFLSVFLPSVLTKTMFPCCHGGGKGLEYLWAFYPHHSLKYKSTCCRMKTKSRGFFFSLFGFTLSLCFHAAPRCSALPELRKRSEYRKQSGATKDHQASSTVNQQGSWHTPETSDNTGPAFSSMWSPCVTSSTRMDLGDAAKYSSSESLQAL